MSRKKLFQMTPVGKVFLSVLAVVYMAYLAGLGGFLYATVSAPAGTIVEHMVDTSASVSLQHWTTASMLNATDADQQYSNLADFTQSDSTPGAGKPAQQQGQPPANSNVSYPLSTVGKVFFSNASGQNMVCSGTAIVSSNKSTVDTAGHCIYWNGAWVKNLIFCPLYNNGSSPYGCWAASALEAPSDWIDAKPNDLHHDLGMVIVSANDQGLLTDVVGGAGWAYNQTISQSFSAYGYPAAYPFDGQSRKSCENVSGKVWQHAGGTVVSIPCNMTGGSSGGPWFIKVGNDWYLNGHNDFTSSIQPGHMFSPIYDDTWHTLYEKAQKA